MAETHGSVRVKKSNVKKGEPFNRNCSFHSHSSLIDVARVDSFGNVVAEKPARVCVESLHLSMPTFLLEISITVLQDGG